MHINTFLFRSFLDGVLSSKLLFNLVRPFNARVSVSWVRLKEMTILPEDLVAHVASCFVSLSFKHFG